MRRLKPIQVADRIEALAEHAIETNLQPREIANQLIKRQIEIVLDLERGNRCAAARRMGAHRNTVSRWIREYGIELAKGYTAKHGNRGGIL